MFCTYPEDVMPLAMENLGDMYAYAVERWNYDIDNFQKLFLESGTAKAFESGDVELIGGMSGSELANYVLWASGLPQRELDHGYDFSSPEYLAGRTAAQYQRISGWSFEELHRVLPMSRIVELVSPPEMDDHDMFLAVSDELCRICNPEAWETMLEYEERQWNTCR